jgi:hypothetical protein
VATFEVIAPSSAPKPMTAAGRLFARMREYESFVASIGEGQVGRLAPEAGDSAHGLELRIVRAAKRNGTAAETWVVDGIVYFRVTAPTSGPRRSRPQREAQSEKRRSKRPARA